MRSIHDATAIIIEKEVENRRLLDALRGSNNTDNSEFLEWIADRLVEVHGDRPNVDFVLSLRDRARKMQDALIADTTAEESDERIDFITLVRNAHLAVQALSDWCGANEENWGDMTPPPGVTFWRVKADQALKAIDEFGADFNAAIDREDALKKR